jgi:hypothetical protein
MPTVKRALSKPKSPTPAESQSAERAWAWVTSHFRGKRRSQGLPKSESYEISPRPVTPETQTCMIKEDSKKSIPSFTAATNVDSQSAAVSRNQKTSDRWLKGGPSVPPLDLSKKLFLLSSPPRLYYQILLESYSMLVEEGTCEAVNFGKSLASAKSKIKRKVKSLEQSHLVDDPVVQEELRQAKRSRKAIRSYEQQERLSIEKESREAYERDVKNANVRRKRKYKELETEQRHFPKRPIMFTKSTRKTRHKFCECEFSTRCTMGCATETTPPLRKELMPRCRTINIFDLEDGGEDEALVGQSDINQVKRNSLIALTSLLHSLEFLLEEQQAS